MGGSVAPWAFIVFLVAAISIIGFGVNKAKARAATQRWLGRCYYGNGYEGEKPYQNLNEEVEGLKILQGREAEAA